MMHAQGFVVVAAEHADGTAATVQLAGRAGHKFYGGWGSQEERLAQTRCLCTSFDDPAAWHASISAPASCSGRHGALKDFSIALSATAQVSHDGGVHSV